MTTSLTTVVESVVEGVNPDLNPGLEQLQSHATLEPGCFWRVKNDVTLVDAKSARYTQAHTFRSGDIYLLLSLFVFDGSLQSVTVLAPPKYGHLNEVVIPVGEFMANFEPATEAEAEVDAVDVREALGPAEALTGFEQWETVQALHPHKMDHRPSEPTVIVFLIDADNLSSPAWVNEAITSIEATEGPIAVRRAYGSAENLKGLAEPLRDWAIRPFLNVFLTKNTTAMALGVDAMELACQTPAPHTVVVGSGDADFVPLVVRLRERGIKVLCVSEYRKMAP